jgi:hypothetical protein
VTLLKCFTLEKANHIGIQSLPSIHGYGLGQAKRTVGQEHGRFRSRDGLSLYHRYLKRTWTHIWDLCASGRSTSMFKLSYTVLVVRYVPYYASEASLRCTQNDFNRYAGRCVEIILWTGRPRFIGKWLFLFEMALALAEELEGTSSRSLHFTNLPLRKFRRLQWTPSSCSASI